MTLMLIHCEPNHRIIIHWSHNGGRLDLHGRVLKVALIVALNTTQCIYSTEKHSDTADVGLTLCKTEKRLAADYAAGGLTRGKTLQRRITQ